MIAKYQAARGRIYSFKRNGQALIHQLPRGDHPSVYQYSCRLALKNSTDPRLRDPAPERRAGVPLDAARGRRHGKTGGELRGRGYGRNRLLRWGGSDRFSGFSGSFLRRH